MLGGIKIDFCRFIRLVLNDGMKRLNNSYLVIKFEVGSLIVSEIFKKKNNFVTAVAAAEAAAAVDIDDSIKRKRFRFRGSLKTIFKYC